MPRFTVYYRRKSQISAYKNFDKVPVHSTIVTAANLKEADEIVRSVRGRSISHINPIHEKARRSRAKVSPIPEVREQTVAEAVDDAVRSFEAKVSIVQTHLEENAPIEPTDEAGDLSAEEENDDNICADDDDDFCDAVDGPSVHFAGLESYDRPAAWCVGDLLPRKVLWLIGLTVILGIISLVMRFLPGTSIMDGTSFLHSPSLLDPTALGIGAFILEVLTFLVVLLTEV